MPYASLLSLLMRSSRCRPVGMGKTAVVTALVLANPPSAPSAAANGKSKTVISSSGGASSGSSGKLPMAKMAPAPSSSSSGRSQRHLKLTLVITNNTLVKQWETEVQKFAPTLRVHCLYNGAGSGREQALRELGSTDVIITTPHAKWPGEITGGNPPSGTV